MNVNHRKRILENIDSLVQLTDFNELCQAGIRNHLLSTTMIHNIHRLEPHYISGDYHDYDDEIKRERHKRLFIKITKRGPDAFEKLRRIFISLKYKEALKVLFDGDSGMISISSSKIAGEPMYRNEDIKNDNKSGYSLPLTFGKSDSDGDVILHEYKGMIKPKKNVVVRKAANIIIDPNIATYPMESRNNRGIFFMVSSDEQQDQELDEDVQSLLSLFQQLGFKLYFFSCLRLDKFFELLEKLLCSDKMNDIECFVLALKTGGRLINGIQWMTFNDGSVVKVEDIQKYFCHLKCKSLVGKPKIFIYPYNETPNRDAKCAKQVHTNNVGYQGLSKQMDQLTDVINCYATTKGFMDDRDIDNYSRYIKRFVNVMAERACDTHFENMLKLIQNNVSDASSTGCHLQMPSYDNISFNKILYFNPGLCI